MVFVNGYEVTKETENKLVLETGVAVKKDQLRFIAADGDDKYYRSVEDE